MPVRSSFLPGGAGIASASGLAVAKSAASDSGGSWVPAALPGGAADTGDSKERGLASPVWLPRPALEAALAVSPHDRGYTPAPLLQKSTSNPSANQLAPARAPASSGPSSALTSLAAQVRELQMAQDRGGAAAAAAAEAASAREAAVLAARERETSATARRRTAAAAAAQALASTSSLVQFAPLGSARAAVATSSMPAAAGSAAAPNSAVSATDAATGAAAAAAKLDELTLRVTQLTVRILAAFGRTRGGFCTAPRRN